MTDNTRKSSGLPAPDPDLSDFYGGACFGVWEFIKGLKKLMKGGDKMIVEFKYELKEKVKIKGLGVSGYISNASVNMEGRHLYWVEMVARSGWFLENEIEKES